LKMSLQTTPTHRNNKARGRALFPIIFAQSKWNSGFKLFQTFVRIQVLSFCIFVSLSSTQSLNISGISSFVKNLDSSGIQLLIVTSGLVFIRAIKSDMGGLSI
jgi:hypothetical protein